MVTPEMLNMCTSDNVYALLSQEDVDDELNVEQFL